MNDVTIWSTLPSNNKKFDFSQGFFHKFLLFKFWELEEIK